MKIKNKTKSQEIGLVSAIWMMFSLIAGISFTLMFSGLNEDPKNFIGYHIVWIILIVSIFLFSSAWAYIKCTRIHNSANGGGGQFVRSAFGPFWGMFFNFISVLCISIVVMIMIVSSIRMSLENIQVVKDTFGNWTKLVLDIFGILACAVGATIVVLGINKFKMASTLIAYTTWAITLLILIFGLVLIFTPSDSAAVKPPTGSVVSTVNLNSFVNVFMLVVFSFTGFETFISTGSAIKNRKKNMPIIVLVGIALATVFFMVFSTIIIASVINDFGGNPNANMFNRFNSVFIQKGGWFIVVICTFLNRFNTMTQLSLYGSNVLEPLIKEGYVSKKLFSSKELKNHIDKKAVFAFFLLNITFATIFLLLPDLIQGITGEESLIGYGTLANVTSLIFISEYIMVMLAAIKFGFKKQVKVNITEYIIWAITIFIFGAICIYTVAQMFIDFVNGINTGNIQEWVAPLIQIVFIITMVIISLVLFFVVKPRILSKLSSEEIKQMEEYQFVTFEILEDEKLKIKTKEVSV
ncbi:hypothetical protein STIUS_v1c02040 [Spiroplasma sp. TIUS-1]|uniref:APC family permease n=1 Tax=Spiroplasma sp. TIUS-1 TaxID=216963 RepID=UPI001397ACEB|nr:APC family permease [Spiroplasma sp. TIUS-1]QHX35759.1 hypothetical protein STIUS_v1c02040 [Spiroplasma sp. TIUS-1]